MKKLINDNKFNQNNNKKEETKMKKLLKATILSTIMLTALTSSAYANSTKVDLYVNNTKLNPDSPAYISNTNRTMVPVSFIANALKFEVNWNAKAEEVVIKDSKTNKTIKLYINNKYALVNNNKVEVDEGKGTAPVIKNSRTMVPLSFITANFGVETKWTKLAADYGRVDMTKAGLVVEVPNKVYPVAPGNIVFEEGKELIPNAYQTEYGNSERLVTMTDAEAVVIRKNLTIYPHTLIQAKNENGQDRIYMKASGGGGTTVFYYKDGKKVGELITGDNHNGWMLVCDPKEMNQFDYMLFYGTYDKLVPAHKEVSKTYNQNIRTIN